MTNVLSLQSELASEIAAQLLGELVSGAHAADRSIDAEAYEAYLKVLHWRNQINALMRRRGTSQPNKNNDLGKIDQKNEEKKSYLRSTFRGRNANMRSPVQALGPNH